MSEWKNRSDVISVVSCLLERGLSRGYVYDGVYAVDGRLKINRNVISVFADIHKPVNGSPPRTEISMHINVNPEVIAEEDLTDKLSALAGIPLRVKIYNGMKPAVILEGENAAELMDDFENVVRKLSGNGYSFVSDYVRV